ncbi:Uncharacterized protein TPAR_05632 [Tolypocladium paradoxum]|uniref:Uncharacterized protein n=1 Tax=Tolypocladium paradoxum TaxID=94208 RepID=A0A2S4KVF3_9HYPO|nr:Uncharacterized protein TPAR_05632 [Tolypocladium paradoxum]
MAQSAAAGPCFTASSGHDVPPPSSLSPHPFVLHRRSHTGWGASPTSDTLARTRSASNLLDTGSGFYAGDLQVTLQIGENIRSLRARDDVAALVDFLRNHPPPPDNFMSTPYGADGDEERGRWSKIKNMGKRRSKSAPRAPRNIRLPDSAVSGMTIGGHRHIAISIPLEASPFGGDMRSQYPVYPQQDLSMGTPSKEPVRTFTNDKGVVTVLRPVTEVSEASGPSPSQPRSPYSGGQRPPSHRGRTSHAPGHWPTGSLGGKPHDYIGILPTRFDTPLLDDSSAPWNRVPSRGEASGRGGQSPQTFQRSAYPARGSSIVTGRNMHHPASIDGLISQQERWRNATCGPRDGTASGLDEDGAVPRTTATTECAAKQAKPNKPAPIFTSGRPAAVKRQDGRGPRLTVISDNPIVSRRDDSPPPTPGSMRSRRDVVRDKKRRDMEAVRNAMHQQTHGRQGDAGETEKPKPAGEFKDDTPGRAERNDNDESVQHLTMSNVMVVADVEPCPSLEERTSPPRQEMAPASGPPSDARPDSPRPLLPAKDSNVPTPPVSPNGSPPQTRSAMDRTSLTRRREWKAIREQEHKGRDPLALSRGKAQRLASGRVSYDGSNGSQTDKEIMRLYEAYREHRLKDMERRLRRLERNGDIWLQALIPVLDNMNRTMAAAKEEPMDAARDSASDDEAASVVERVGRDAERRTVARRASLPQGRVPEMPANHQQDDEDSRSDMSGLGTIEPLMRELAGGARRRRSMKTARTLAICDEGAYHAI